MVPFEFDVMERERMRFLILCLVLVFSFHVYAAILTLELSTSEGFTVAFGSEDLRLKVGYPHFGIEGSRDFLEVFELSFNADVNLNFPATDARCALNLKTNIGMSSIAVGMGVELRNLNRLAEDLTERGRFFIRMVVGLNFGDVMMLSLLWDRYVFSILETPEGIMFNHFTINDSPLSDNRIFFGLRVSLDVMEDGEVSLGCGYMMNAGWLRSMERMGYSLNEFIFELGISKVF